MNSTTILALSAITVVFVMLTTSAQADAVIYVKIPNIPGDSTIDTPGYDDGKWFIADSFSFGVEREIKESGEKGGTEDINIGVGELQPVSISKSMDSASPLLAQFAINGNSAGSAEINFVELDGLPPGETPVPYLVYKLERVFVTSWQTSTDDDPASEDRPRETVTFGYNKIAYGTNPNDAEEPDPNIIMSWDLKKNRPWTDIFDDILEILFPSLR